MNLLIFGAGYTAKAVASALQGQANMRGTTRKAKNAETLHQAGFDPRLFPGDDLAKDLAWASHVLITAGPQNGQDPVLAHLCDAFAQNAGRLVWVGYLSTTGVYGDHQGGWVDETTPPNPQSDRGHARVMAERDWQSLHADYALPLHLFRLPGIYGPGRGPLAKLRAGTARRIIKDNQFFSRAHVDDIAQVLVASMRAPNPGSIYNIADDVPAPPQDVIEYAAHLLGLPIPPAIPFDQAEMTPMARSFYGESKKVDNAKIKAELGIRLIYPDYMTGLRSLIDEAWGDQ
jgi:nucleoside-diphosphate-sugar epimerase